MRQYLQPVQAATTQHRHQLATLKKQVTQLERELGRLRRGAAAASSAPAADAGAAPKVRFVAKGFSSLRARLGFSAAELGLLLGVSTQTIYNWETKKATPRAEQIAAIAALRGIGKKEARARIEQIAPAVVKKNKKAA